MTIYGTDPSAEWGASDEEPKIDRTQRRYWWVMGIHQGRRVILGPFMTEEEATQIGYNKVGGNFEVRALPTRDEASATRMLKGRLVEDVDLDEAMKRFKHPGQSQEGITGGI